MGFQVGVLLSVVGGVMAGVTFAIGVTCGVLAIPHRLKARREMAAQIKNKAKWKESYLNSMIKKHGSYEAYRAYMREIASKGGSKEVDGRGFAKSPELAKEAAKRSHESRRRGKKSDGEENSAR